jgi:type I restriction enzyme S subunit
MSEINDNLEQQAQAIFKSWFVDFELFRDGEFVESELGMIPKGWRVGTLGDLVYVRYGKDHKKLSDGDIPVYGSGGIMRYANQALYDKESILIPRKGTLNNVFYIDEPFWSVDTMFFTEMKCASIAKYIYFFLVNRDLASMNAGSAVPSMTTEILNSLSIVIPSEKDLKRYDLLVAPMFQGIKNNVRYNTSLSQLRDTLLPKLMSGELSVEETESQV